MKKLAIKEMTPYDAAIAIKNEVDEVVSDRILNSPIFVDPDYMADMYSVDVELPGATESATLEVFAQVDDHTLDDIKDECLALLSVYDMDGEVETCSKEELVIKFPLG